MFVKMITYVIFYYFLSLMLKSSSAASLGDGAALWLPKCCPKGKQLTSDEKSCVVDDTDNLENSLTDDGSNSSHEVLPITINNKTVFYKLEHRHKFNCARHEVYFIRDDIIVSPEGGVIVYDKFGGNWTLSPNELCVDSVYVPESLGLGTTRIYIALLCPSCQRVSCVHKCCLESERLQVAEDATKADCIGSSGSSWTEGLLDNALSRPFAIHGFPECSHGIYIKYLDRSAGVSAHGHLIFQGKTITRTEYCGDKTDGGSVFLACRHTLVGTLKPSLYGGLFCLGALFLALTLGLHLWLPELRKSLHSRVLVAHVSCLLVGYLALAAANLAPLNAPSTVCSFIAFVIQFTILAAIFWLNVMCVDIAWTFSGLRAPKASLTLDSDGHKFLYYSLYAWGSTAAISAVTAFLEYNPIVPLSSRFKPSFGVMSCWFQHWESILLLFYGPMGILLLVNVVLFLYTACKIRRTQRDTADLVQHAGSKLRDNSERFSLYLKLFGLMGITWVFEVISWVTGGPQSYWYITDIINALRGVFIFILFCLKKKVLLIIKSRLFPKRTSKFPIHPRKATVSSKLSSSMSSQRTNSIQMSHVK